MLPSLRLIALGAVLGLLAACQQPEPEPAPVVVLAKVGQAEITAADFAAALRRLDPTGAQQAGSLDEWRARLQPLIDKQLLLLEAHHLGLAAPDGPAAQAAAGQTRAWLIERLLAAQMGDSLAWDEDELAAFFAAEGGGREIRVSRLVLRQRSQAATALQRARQGESLAELAAAYKVGGGDMGWINPLVSGDMRAAALLGLDVGSVELIEAAGSYFLFAVTDERQVTLEQRRTLVAGQLTQRKQAAANMAYLKYLTEQYEVRLDTATISHLVQAGAAAKRDLPLLRSSLGVWSVGDFLASLERLGTPGLQTSAAGLGFQVTRTYLVGQLLDREAEAQGLVDSVALQRQNFLENRLLEAVFQARAADKVEIDPTALQAFYQANKARYDGLKAGLEQRDWQERLQRDWQERQAGPLFEAFLRDLRQRRAAEVEINQERLNGFIARQRQAEVPF